MRIVINNTQKAFTRPKSIHEIYEGIEELIQKVQFMTLEGTTKEDAINTLNRYEIQRKELIEDMIRLLELDASNKADVIRSCKWVIHNPSIPKESTEEDFEAWGSDEFKALRMDEAMGLHGWYHNLIRYRWAGLGILTVLQRSSPESIKPGDKPSTNSLVKALLILDEMCELSNELNTTPQSMDGVTMDLLSFMAFEAVMNAVVEDDDVQF